MKDALVTLIGGGGFLGRYVAQALMRQGARIRIVQRRPRDAWFLKPLGGLGQSQFVAGDVTRPETIANAVAGSDAVVNLAGTFKASDFDAVHADGARTVAEAARSAGVSALVHVSAIGADPASRAGYGRSKAAGEAAVRAAFPSAAILRPSVLFGREDRFVNRFAGMIAGLPVMPVLRGGTRFQPAYVADAADAVVAALADRQAHGGRTYELGGPDTLTLIEIYRWIAREIGRDIPFIELPDAIGALVPLLPGAPITGDQWKMLAHDNVVAAGAEGFAALGVQPTPLATVAPAWLVRFRRHGRFGKLGAA
ncbi:MAG: complex I NDUFA9 subunit family protein [Pseudomonadota bacterium]